MAVSTGPPGQHYRVQRHIQGGDRRRKIREFPSGRLRRAFPVDILPWKFTGCAGREPLAEYDIRLCSRGRQWGGHCNRFAPVDACYDDVSGPPCDVLVLPSWCCTLHGELDTAGERDWQPTVNPLRYISRCKKTQNPAVNRAFLDRDYGHRESTKKH